MVVNLYLNCNIGDVPAMIMKIVVDISHRCYFIKEVLVLEETLPNFFFWGGGQN